MGAKNRTKRKHAVDRRNRRDAFFSESQTTRGTWEVRAERSKSPYVANRKNRRGFSVFERREMNRFGQGRWVRDLAFAIRGFVRRSTSTESKASRALKTKRANVATSFVESMLIPTAPVLYLRPLPRHPMQVEADRVAKEKRARRNTATP